MDTPDFFALEQRMGRDLLTKRLLKQADKSAKLLHQGEGIFRLERFVPFDTLVSFALAATGLRGMARRNFLGVGVVTREWALPRLPQAFDGFRLLQLTDLHLDLDPALTPVIKQVVRSVPHDAAVVTGDFRNETDGDYHPCLRATGEVIRELALLRWGVLGNHDFLEMVPSLEADGLPILLNEVATIDRSGEKLCVAGIDDPHFYRTHDLKKVRSEVPPGACVILLSHSPETYAEAAALDFDLQLSGHTHGGQLCLPGGIPVVLPCRVDRQFVCGPWRHGSLQGYTSPGTGSCGVAARLNCPPEVTLHILRRS